ncbi:LamG domain-containing protein [Paenibacillus sp. FSL K6-1122]|uniref:LamG domain-containing protein n=1 Tax=Paenibacillus sp. FSL K6-1122 TaxID=2954512 RepID=UPI0030EED04C
MTTQELMNLYGVAWFKMDEATGNSLIDSKGSAVATFTGTPMVIDGYSNKAKQFNGSSQYVRFNARIMPIGAKSIRFKIKTTSLSGIIIANHDNSSNVRSGLAVALSNGTVVFTLLHGNNSTFPFQIRTTTTVNDDKWHDVLFTWDGTTSTNGIKLYVDDMYNPQVTGTSRYTEINTPSDNLSIASSYAGGTLLNGALDEIEIYNQAITISPPPISKILLSSSNGFYSLKDSSVYKLSIDSEENFLSYGADSITSFNGYLTKLKDIKNTSTDLGSGKTFEHTIDMSKRRVDKITLG